MDDGSWSMLIGIAILMVISGTFAALETALSNANTIRLKGMAEDGNQRAKTALKVIDRYEKALSTILIVGNIMDITTATISAIIFTDWLGDSGAWVSTAVTTVLVLTFGEILPKTLGRYNSDRILLRFAGILNFAMLVFTPITSLYTVLQKSMSKRFTAENKAPSVTGEELKHIIETTYDEGVLEEEEADLVQSALGFSDITVQEILTPRVDVVAIDIEDNIEEVLNLIIEERYTRLPVYEKTIDRIVGILQSRDLLEAVIKKREISLKDMITEPYYIHKTKSLTALLAEFQHMRLHIAVVTDGYGGTVGIVTMEDLLEQLVGDIWDEDDEVVEAFVKIGVDTYQASGDMDVEDMFVELDFVDKNFESEYYSLSGWVLSQFEHMPVVGETLNYKGIDIMVAELDDRRITKLLITYHPPEEIDD